MYRLHPETRLGGCEPGAEGRELPCLRLLKRTVEANMAQTKVGMACACPVHQERGIRLAQRAGSSAIPLWLKRQVRILPHSPWRDTPILVNEAIVYYYSIAQH